MIIDHRNKFFYSAKYLAAAGVTLKFLYLSFFPRHALHMLRSCAMKVRSHFEDVNQLIFKVQTSKD